MKIKQLLEIRKMSKQHLADAVGITTNTLRNYEKGKNEPLLKTVIKMAEVLNCSLETLAGLDNKNIIDKKMLPVDKQKLIDEILNLESEKVPSVLAFIKVINNPQE